MESGKKGESDREERLRPPLKDPVQTGPRCVQEETHRRRVKRDTSVKTEVANVGSTG